MRYIKKIILLLVVVPFIAFAKPQATEEIEIPLSPKEYITLYASLYGSSSDELLKVGYCESGLNPKAINYHDGGKGKHSFGIFQYQQETFIWMSKLMGENLDYYSYHDQAKLTSWIFANHPELKIHWSCYKMNY